MANKHEKAVRNLGKPPDNVVAYYIKLYCEKKKKIGAGKYKSRGIQRAKTSWMSLSAEERQLFCDKYAQCMEKYKENCAAYLKLVEPFLKKKQFRNLLDNKTATIDSEVNTIENQLQTAINTSENSNNYHVTDSDIDQDAVFAASNNMDSDLNEDEPQSKQGDMHTEEMQSDPSAFLHLEVAMEAVSNTSGKELYESLNTRGSHLEWKELSQNEKLKYLNAARAIKNEYVKKYETYLENLPSQDLFKHYIKTMKKYSLFYSLLRFLTID